MTDGGGSITVMSKISIIMPLYNAERYLEECLNSVSRQTFTDFELICVNDASTDSTLEIVEHFREKDTRIRILSNEVRSGAAYSRNRGMEEAAGEYLSFLDGDDIFDEEMLCAAYQAAEECKADIVMYEYKHVPSDAIRQKLRVSHGETFKERYCRMPFSVQEQGPHEWLNWGLSPCNKLYKKEFIQKQRLSFQNLPSSNDVFFVCMALMLSERSLLLDDERIMLYARDHEEPDRISADRDPMCAYQAFVCLAEELQKRGILRELYAHFYYRFCRAMISVLRQCKTEKKVREFYRFLQEEGMDQVSLITGENYGQLDDFIKSMIEQFKFADFDSRWYKEELGLKMQLSQKVNAKAVTDLWKEYREQHKKIGIWGVGANGISLLQFCRENQLQVDMVIDKSKAKQGSMIEGYHVEAPEDIGDQIQVMIVSTRYIAESVREELFDRKTEVIDLNEFLCVY